MQVYVVGAHNVGKTTLAKKLSAELSLLYKPEIAEDWFKLEGKTWFGSAKKADRNVMSILEYLGLESTLALWHLQLKSETNFVSDRSLVDVCAYTWNLLVHFKDEIDRHPLRDLFYACFSQINKPENFDLRSDSIYIFVYQNNMSSDAEQISKFILNRLKILKVNYIQYNYKVHTLEDIVSELWKNF